MKLAIPLIRQAPNSSDCGITCLAMIMNYWGVGIDQDEIKKSLEVDEVGTYLPQLGSYLLEKDFSVKLTTFHPILFLEEEVLAGEPALERFSKLKEFRGEKSEKNRKALDHFLDFLKKGGEIEAKIPSKQDIVEELKEKRPILANMLINFENKEPGFEKIPLFDFHGGVVCGFDKENVFVMDPLWDERGGEKRYSFEKFFFKVYTACFGDLDNSGFLKVEKKS